MKTLSFISLYMLLFLFACQGKKEAEIVHISIEPEKTTQLSLSEIAEDIQAIELEVTDKSMIGAWHEGYKVFPLDKYIIFSEYSRYKSQILLFDTNGKFIRSIGKKGGGPGEFSSIVSVAVNDKEQRIYVISTSHKIICYNFQNQFLFERSVSQDFEHIHQFQDKLYLFTTTIGEDGYNKTVCYKTNKDLQITDSLTVQQEERDKRLKFSAVPTVAEPLSIVGDQVYFHRPKFASEPRSCDTLYEIRNKALIPSIIVCFEGEEKYIPNYIFRNSHFVCMHYSKKHFCYDLRTGKGYNLKNGYTDDLYSGAKVMIRSFPHDSERFYYLHTNIKDTDKDEPNPTLYIGRFKQ